MTTVRVHLADAPTDVLVWLVKQPQHRWFGPDEIADAVAPEDADNAYRSVQSALTLLWEMGYVIFSREADGWAATADGQRAVEEAS